MLLLQGRISCPQNMTFCVIGRVRFERNCGKMYSPPSFSVRRTVYDIAARCLELLKVKNRVFFLTFVW